jgi:hypothetical protein
MERERDAGAWVRQWLLMRRLGNSGGDGRGDVDNVHRGGTDWEDRSATAEGTTR